MSLQCPGILVYDEQRRRKDCNLQASSRKRTGWPLLVARAVVPMNCACDNQRTQYLLGTLMQDTRPADWQACHVEKQVCYATGHMMIACWWGASLEWPAQQEVMVVFRRWVCSQFSQVVVWLGCLHSTTRTSYLLLLR